MTEGEKAALNEAIIQLVRAHLKDSRQRLGDMRACLDRMSRALENLDRQRPRAYR